MHSLSRRTFIKAAPMTIATLATPSLDCARPSGKCPNILFILADDMGLIDTTLFGSKYYETPNLERFASRGMQDCPIMASMLRGMDESIGRILDRLEELKIAGDTIIVFMSDKGGSAPGQRGSMVIHFGMRAKAKGGGQFFWADARRKNFGPGQRIGFDITHDGKWREYSVSFETKAALKAMSKGIAA